LASAIAGDVGVAPMYAENDSRQDMSCDWEGDEERFERDRLVEGSCEEEVLF
jgi:hypothetical protein